MSLHPKFAASPDEISVSWLRESGQDCKMGERTPNVAWSVPFGKAGLCVPVRLESPPSWESLLSLSVSWLVPVQQLRGS